MPPEQRLCTSVLLGARRSDHPAAAEAGCVAGPHHLDAVMHLAVAAAIAKIRFRAERPPPPTAAAHERYGYPPMTCYTLTDPRRSSATSHSQSRIWAKAPYSWRSRGLKAPCDSNRGKCPRQCLAAQVMEWRTGVPSRWPAGRTHPWPMQDMLALYDGYVVSGCQYEIRTRSITTYTRAVSSSLVEAGGTRGTRP
jgi:hypothetical protein